MIIHFASQKRKRRNAIIKIVRPKRIILIRHGKSEGNEDKKLLETVPDYALNLTQEGIEQARLAGREIKKIIGQETIQVYISPYYRTRQTYQYIQESINDNAVKIFEDPRIREQDWGHLRNMNLMTKFSMSEIVSVHFITEYQMANLAQMFMTGLVFSLKHCIAIFANQIIPIMCLLSLME